MVPNGSERDGSQGERYEDKGWINEAVGSLTREDKERAEEEVDRAVGRIKEASSTLSSGRHRDKAAGTKDKVKGWIKETSSSLTGNQEKRAEGRADQLKGVAKDKKGHLKDLFKFP